MEEKIRGIIKKAAGVADASVEVPEREEFGHYSTNMALRLSRTLKKPPLAVAEELAAKIAAAAPKGFLERVEAAPPGFVNFWISREALCRATAGILKAGERYGAAGRKKAGKIQVEYISANPTGPLTLANGRGGFFGDVLANVLEKAGRRVEREYYVNDTGGQIVTLGKSLLAAGGFIAPEETFYKGAYIKRWAAAHEKVVARCKDKPLKLGQRAAADFMRAIRKVIGKKARIRFDRYTSEHRDLHRTKLVEKAREFFARKGLTYEKDGAVWLKTTSYGDDKDRVLVKSDGGFTYLLADSGHNLDTLKRGFASKILILGPDHHGYVGRMKAAAAIVGLDLRIVITQALRLVAGGKEVTMSKRRGSFVEFEELLDEVGADAARFFFLSVSNDTHLDFDLDLAKERSVKNPVYYAQYAHARAANILKKVKSQSGNRRAKIKTADKVRAALLNTAEDGKLMRQLVQLPDVLRETAEDYQVHRIPRYTLEVARAFHDFYEKERVAGEAEEVASARAALVRAAKIVLKNTLGTLGIAAPEKM